MEDNFYRAFEERFRGSRENIKEKQKIYLPFVKPLHQLYPESIVLDIGCGRGEWLELMREEGIPAKGVDLDSGMLEAGRKVGLDVLKGDGIVFLQNMEENSAIVVTAFHVVEHISFEQLRTLVEEAQRVLKPGGLLILETPNPENIRVASESFYLDPTHVKPIPSAQLAFVSEYYGFLHNKVVRLQESMQLSSQKYANIGQVLEGASPDYAVIAQKKAETETMTALNEVFSKSYGLSLSNLIEKFERRMLRFEELVDKILLKTAKAEEFAWKAEVSTVQAQESAREASENAKYAAESARNADENARNAWIHYQAVVNSYSWKLALPLRLAGKIAKRLKRVAGKVFKKSVYTTRAQLQRSPKLKRVVGSLLNRFPGAKQKLKSFISTPKTDPGTVIDPPKYNFPNSKTIVSDLQQMIEQKKGEN